MLISDRDIQNISHNLCVETVLNYSELKTFIDALIYEMYTLEERATADNRYNTDYSLIIQTGFFDTVQTSPCNGQLIVLAKTVEIVGLGVTE